jgi:hypothetical protein
MINFTARDATEYDCTTATKFEDMPEMEVIFDLGGLQASSVIAMFQGRWRLGNQNKNPPFNGIPRIQLVIDEVVQSGPGGNGPAPVVPGVARIQDEKTGGFNFISDPQEPGVHTAKIQWRSEAENDEICVEARSFIVLHR